MNDSRTAPRILVITPVHHIAGVCEILERAGEVTYLEDPTPEEVAALIGGYHAIFTNPNKSRVFIGRDILDAGRELKVICTASTGTNHIDKEYAAVRNVPILALTEERAVINRISSTAEHAFALTMAALRNVVRGHNAVVDGDWDYTKYIGRQMNCLTIGIVGYGRLGGMYASYCRAFGASVMVYDPYKSVSDRDIVQVDRVDELVMKSDVISLHVHVTRETLGMVDKSWFGKMKPDVLIVNTARGDVVNEEHLVDFLSQHPGARVASDVLADEIRGRTSSPLLRFAQGSQQVVLTPHVGGMTREAQEIAYGHAARRLADFFA